MNTEKINTIFLNKISNLFWKEVLRGILILTNEKELIIAHRLKAIKRIKASDYSHGYTYIPFDQIKEIKIKENEKYLDVRDLVIETVNNTIVFNIGDQEGFEDWIDAI
jgi:hypothetical protein